MNDHLKPLHEVYRCEDGHEMRSLGNVQPPPETLLCNHVLEGSQDACRKVAKRFHGRSTD
jgi:hypothetical protein